MFVVASRDPPVIMREYARITGLPEMPAQWTFGYMQSHRTLAGPDEILSGREDVPREEAAVRRAHLSRHRVHAVGLEHAQRRVRVEPRELSRAQGDDRRAARPALQGRPPHRDRGAPHVGTVERSRVRRPTPCRAAAMPTIAGRQIATSPATGRTTSRCYDLGVDGWWPDQGDGLDGPSRLVRHRMYWEGTQQWRPNERPFALHRNGYAGMQRYGAFIWSGDVQSRWETLETHVPIAVNTGLSGIRTGAPTSAGSSRPPEFTGELHVRWFQFGAFCPFSARTAGTGTCSCRGAGTAATAVRRRPTASRPSPRSCNNPHVEPILKKYLELRYRLMPYLYTAVREMRRHGTADHPRAVAASSRRSRRRRPRRRVLWGRDMLVAPVVEKGATARRLYLPTGRGTTSGRTSSSRAAARSTPGRPGDDAAVRARRRDRPDGPREAVH